VAAWRCGWDGLDNRGDDVGHSVHELAHSLRFFTRTFL